MPAIKWETEDESMMNRNAQTFAAKDTGEINDMYRGNLMFGVLAQGAPDRHALAL